ncbi:hypothetical protein CC80DRAFT_208647 [Byssothecium circinans]|uniref:Uncharacterized protein n=1 Tax=Byssothecium circinans TaxID=147558 RepID=A0A6A5THZ9_9PLEO|nr:hypothetical protein CC80DRAFT_208647 [Byssothecium circinans]
MCNAVFVVPDTLLEPQTRVTIQINHDGHDRTIEMEDFEEPIQTTDALGACTPNDQSEPMEWLDYLRAQMEVSYRPTDVAGLEGFVSTPLDAFTPSEYSFDARTASSDGYAEIFHQRRLGSHWDPVVAKDATTVSPDGYAVISHQRCLGSHLDRVVAKTANDMRKVVACWHCVL